MIDTRSQLEGRNGSIPRRNLSSTASSLAHTTPRMIAWRQALVSTTTTRARSMLMVRQASTRATVGSSFPSLSPLAGVVGLVHQQSPLWQLSSSHECLRTLKDSSSVGRRSTELVVQVLRSPSLLARPHQTHRASKNSMSHVPSSRSAWLGGNNHRTSLPRRSFVGSNMESRSSSKRVFPLRRNPRHRNSSTRKMCISRFKIFSRTDGSGYINVSALGCREVVFIGKHGQNPKLV